MDVLANLFSYSDLERAKMTKTQSLNIFLGHMQSVCEVGNFLSILQDTA